MSVLVAIRRVLQVFQEEGVTIPTEIVFDRPTFYNLMSEFDPRVDGKVYTGRFSCIEIDGVLIRC